MKIRSFSWMFIVLFLSFSGFSQEKDAESDDKGSELSVFAGGISSTEATAFAIGLDYQYRFNKVVGIGALVDYSTGDFNSVLTGVALFLHAGDVEFTLAPGVEFSEDVDLAFRFGIAYEFELKKVSISPSVFYDTVRNEKPAWVYGLSFGFKI
jgi:hypothetical protein